MSEAHDRLGALVRKHLAGEVELLSVTTTGDSVEFSLKLGAWYGCVTLDMEAIVAPGDDDAIGELVLLEVGAVVDEMIARARAPRGAVSIGLGARCPNHDQCAVTALMIGTGTATFKCAASPDAQPFPALAYVTRGRRPHVYRSGVLDVTSLNGDRG